MTSKITVTAKIEGVPEAKEMLEQFAPRQAANILRATFRGAASEFRKRVRARVRAQSYKTGQLFRAIILEVSQKSQYFWTFKVGAILKRGDDRSAWHWGLVEYGTWRTRAKPYLKPELEVINQEMDGILKDQFAAKFLKAVQRNNTRRK